MFERFQLPVDGSEGIGVMEIAIGGQPVTIRPIRMDMELESDFIRSLTPDSKHFRFLCGASILPASELRRLCDVDGRKRKAFVASVHRDGCEVKIGVCRFAPNASSDVQEIAVTISDEWQHKGLESMLMRALIESAKSTGVRQLYSIDTVDNTAMSALAKELGMSSSPGSGPRQVVHSLTL